MPIRHHIDMVIDKDTIWMKYTDILRKIEGVQLKLLSSAISMKKHACLRSILFLNNEKKNSCRSVIYLPNGRYLIESFLDYNI